MKLKQFVRYEMNFNGFAANVCAGSIGLSFFLRILYYFGLVNLKDIGAEETFFFLILPWVQCPQYTRNILLSSTV